MTGVLDVVQAVDGVQGVDQVVPSPSPRHQTQNSGKFTKTRRGTVQRSTEEGLQSKLV